jgi:hypothetical protein
MGAVHIVPNRTQSHIILYQSAFHIFLTGKNQNSLKIKVKSLLATALLQLASEPYLYLKENPVYNNLPTQHSHVLCFILTKKHELSKLMTDDRKKLLSTIN